ncbi:MAG: M67 family metallopeptidase [Anaerolineales bacterium]|nr:M67 family metallopeptidase [Anaerolineales bacterium]
MTLSLPRSLLDRIWDDGQAHYPEEGAGLILGSLYGDHRLASSLLPLANSFEATARGRRYRLGAADMLRAEAEADRLELDILGVYHSHPDHPPLPSEYDCQWALPFYSYVITSVRQGRAVESRCWRLTEDRAEMVEQALEILPEEAS